MTTFELLAAISFIVLIPIVAAGLVKLFKIE